MIQLAPEQLTAATREINERIGDHHRRWALSDPPRLLEGQVEIALTVLEKIWGAYHQASNGAFLSLETVSDKTQPFRMESPKSLNRVDPAVEADQLRSEESEAIPATPDVPPLTDSSQLISRMPVMVSPMVHEPAQIDILDTTSSHHNGILTLNNEAMGDSPRIHSNGEGESVMTLTHPSHIVGNNGPSAPEPATEKYVSIQYDALTDDELRETLANELARLAAKLGHTPTLIDWNRDRDRSLPTANVLCRRLNLSWAELAATVSQSPAALTNLEPTLPAGIPQPAPQTHQEAMKKYREERRELLLKTVRELSVDGSMVTMADYNAKKPAELGSAGAMMNQLGYTEWGEVAKDAGVKWFGPRGKSK